jgi:hypothetical protein
MPTRCTHLDHVRTKTPNTDGCEECLAMGDTSIHLRLCRVCGHVGCCDSSKNRHATKHFHATGHPIMSQAVVSGATRHYRPRSLWSPLT